MLQQISSAVSQLKTAVQSAPIGVQYLAYLCLLEKDFSWYL